VLCYSILIQLFPSYFFLFLSPSFLPLPLARVPLTVCVVPKTQMWPQKQKEEKNTSSMYAGEIKALVFSICCCYGGWNLMFFQISLYSGKGHCSSVLDIKCQHTLKMSFVKLLIIAVVGRSCHANEKLRWKILSMTCFLSTTICKQKGMLRCLS